jgi:hypothetical protein
LFRGLNVGGVGSDEVKLAIVSAVGIHGATVSKVAQRHDETRQKVCLACGATDMRK